MIQGRPIQKLLENPAVPQETQLKSRELCLLRRSIHTVKLPCDLWSIPIFKETMPIPEINTAHTIQGFSGTQSMLEADKSVSRSMFFKNIVALNFADESVCLCAFQVWPSGQDVFDTMNMTFTIIFLALGQQSPGVLVEVTIYHLIFFLCFYLWF